MAADGPAKETAPDFGAPLIVADSTAGSAKSIFDEKPAGAGAAVGAPSAPAPAAGGAADTSHDVAEPDDYRQNDYRSPVPKTLKGARVISTAEAEALFADRKAVFIDVYPRAPKPPNLPAGTLWRDMPHTTIKGGHWLPNVGFGVLPPDDEAYLKTQLEIMSGGDKARPLVFFCLRDCWMSWNAGKRALTLGYTNIVWFPDGTDGWQEAGNDTANVQPEAK